MPKIDMELSDEDWQRIIWALSLAAVELELRGKVYIEYELLADRIAATFSALDGQEPQID